MKEQDKEAILNFAEAFAKSRVTFRGKFPDCDIKLYGSWECCLYHRLRNIEHEALSLQANVIDRKYPEIRNGNHIMMVCSVSWFERLQLVTGIQLPIYLTKVSH